MNTQLRRNIEKSSSLVVQCVINKKLVYFNKIKTGLGFFPMLQEGSSRIQKILKFY